MTSKTLIYDVGLHLGEDTDFYLKKGFRVVAFEADPDLVESCKQRFSRELGDGSLAIVEGAIIPDPGGPVTLYKTSVSVWGTTSEKWARRNERLGASNEAITVPSVDFAQCLRNFGIPYYMKIDIEGCDIVCLKALLEFDTSPKYISIESNKTNFAALLNEFDLLERLGYRRFALVQQATIGNQRTLHPAREGEEVQHVFESGSSGPFGRELLCQWNSRRVAVWHYRWVFLLYWLFGDDGLSRNIPLAWRFPTLYRTLTGKPLPGWYDTHARR